MLYVEFKDRQKFESCIKELLEKLPEGAQVNRMRSEVHVFHGDVWACIKFVEE